MTSLVEKAVDQNEQMAEIQPEASNLNADVQAPPKVDPKQTLFIKKVSIKDFMTYQEFNLQGNMSLSQSCNLIVGKNGCGKSSFLKAITYVLSDRYSKLTRDQKRGMFNKISLQNLGNSRQVRHKDAGDPNSFWVEITLDNSLNKIPFNASEINLRKTYKRDTDREDFKINGQTISQKDLYNLFESGGMSLSSNAQLHIVEQGMIQSIVEKGDSGLLEMVKEVTGQAQFDRQMTNLDKSVIDAREKKEQLERTMKLVAEKLTKLKDDVEIYTGFDKVDLDKKAYEKILHLHKIKANQEKMESLRAKKQELMDQREQILNQREDYVRNQSNFSPSKHNQLKEEISLLESQIKSHQEIRKEYQQKTLENFGNMGHNKSMLSTNQTSLLQFMAPTQNTKNQLTEITKKIEKFSSESIDLEKQKDETQKGIYELEQQIDKILKEKDAVLEQIQRDKDPKKLKQFQKQEEERLKVNLAQLGQDLADTTKDIQKIKGQLQTLESTHTEIQQQISQNSVGQNESLAEIEKARKQKREVVTEVQTYIMNQNELEREISNMEKRKLTYTKQLEKFESVFSTVYRIDKICRERGIQGYHGLFLHHIKCTNESMLQCVDLAAKSQLFSIIVDTFETAKEILEINKSIRGTVINIYPLESMKQVYSGDRQGQIPNNKIKKLSEYVKLNPNSNPLLQNLVNKIFSNVVLVENYDQAIIEAKRSNFTCVTPDLQVVYPGAFITKVGHYNRSQADRLTVFKHIMEADIQIVQKQAKLDEIIKNRDQNTNMDLNALRNLQKAELKFNQLKIQNSQLFTTRFDLQQQISRKKSSLQDLLKTQEQLKLSENQIQLKIQQSQTLSNKSSSFDSNQKKLQSQNKDLSDFQISLKMKQSDLVKITTQIDSNNQLVHQTYLPRQQHFQSLLQEQELPQQPVFTNENRDLTLKIQELVELLAQKQSEYEELEQKLTQSQAVAETQTQHQFLIDPSGEDMNVDQKELIQDLRDKTNQVEELSMKIDELYQSSSHIEYMASLIKRYNQKLYQSLTEQKVDNLNIRNQIYELNEKMQDFPRHNKNCIEFHQTYSLRYEELSAKYDQQRKTEEQMAGLVIDMQNKKSEQMMKNFEQLSLNFSQIFSEIVRGGEASLKLQSDKDDGADEKSQNLLIGEQSFKKIKARVNFNGKIEDGDPTQSPKKLDDDQTYSLKKLSGGQKAVVAICFIFAIQKLDAAPFYIMDEFDSALDNQYGYNIAEQIVKLSKTHTWNGQTYAGSQFLITSFKQYMIPHADKIFEVSFKNQQSKMAVTDKQSALDIIKEQDMDEDNSQQ